MPLAACLGTGSSGMGGAFLLCRSPGHTVLFLLKGQVVGWCFSSWLSCLPRWASSLGLPGLQGDGWKAVNAKCPALAAL